MLNFKAVNILCIILFAGGVCFSFFYSVPLYYYFSIFLFWLIVTTIGSFTISLNYFLTAHNRSKNTKKQKISITFDDGPNLEFTPKVLSILKKYNTKATFFCVGENIKKHPDIAKLIIDENHIIGNHSFSHSNFFGFFNSEKVLRELTKTDDIIYNISNEKVKLFRPPFGVTNPNIAKAVLKTKHQVVGWSIRSLDTITKDESKILLRITRKLKSGDIILLHDTNERTPIVLEQLLLFLKKRNFTNVTVDKLLKIKAYE